MKTVSFNRFQHHGLFNVFMYLFIYWRDLIFQKNELAVLNVSSWCSDPDGGMQVSCKKTRDTQTPFHFSYS